jgi:AcrR family transcriptional regulator
MRERYRAQVRDQVKVIALRQLAEIGPAGVSVSAIGKELGVSGPALYRYFANRDALITELVIDAYHDLAEAISEGIGTVQAKGSRAQIQALARAYRLWAVNQPERYRLLFGPPLPAYEAHATRLVEAAQRVMDQLLKPLSEATDIAQVRPSRTLTSQLSQWALRHDLETDPKIALVAILTWSRLHGIVSLEIAGAFASMGIDPQEVFEIELSTLAK